MRIRVYKIPSYGLNSSTALRTAVGSLKAKVVKPDRKSGAQSYRQA